MIAKTKATKTPDKDALIAELKEQNEFLQHSADPFDRLLYRIRKRKEQSVITDCLNLFNQTNNN